MTEVEYNDLLFEISRKLDDLERLKFMCRGKFAEGSNDQIQDVLTLFQELEKKGSLQIDKLEVLKEILTRVKKKPLFKKVEEFETRRKARAAGIFTSIKRTAEKLLGAVKMVCNFRTVAGGILIVSSGMVLRSCSSLQEFTDAFNKIVLPVATKLIEISEGSVCFTVQAENLLALRALWERYQDGGLKRSLEEFLVNDEIKNQSEGQDVEVTVFIDEQEYKEACLDFIGLETEDSSSRERFSEKTRRYSDSVISLKTMESEKMSLELKQSESKLQFERERRQILEKEIANLPAKLYELQSLEMKPAKPGTEESSASSSKERFSEKPRRPSDSVTSLKTMEPKRMSLALDQAESTEEISDSSSRKRFSEKTRRDSDSVGSLKTMEQKKMSLELKQSESKLQFVRERKQILEKEIANLPAKLKEPQSLEMKPAKKGTEDSSEFSYGPIIYEFGSTISQELSRRLENDVEAFANVREAFGLNHSGNQQRAFEEIITAFSRTPVKLLKEVFETLQLYDLVELLESAEVDPRSLQLKGTMQEVKTLRKTDKRQTTYHSNVAVLILLGPQESVDSVKGIETFFKDLNQENDVTIFDVDKEKSSKRELKETELMELRKKELMEKINLEESERELRELRKEEKELREKTKLGDSEKGLREEIKVGDSEKELREKMKFEYSEKELREKPKLGDSEKELREKTKLGDSEKELREKTKQGDSERELREKTILGDSEKELRELRERELRMREWMERRLRERELMEREWMEREWMERELMERMLREETLRKRGLMEREWMETEWMEKEWMGKELMERGLMEKEWMGKELMEKELRERGLMERMLMESKLMERTLREWELRKRKLRQWSVGYLWKLRVEYPLELSGTYLLELRNKIELGEEKRVEQRRQLQLKTSQVQTKETELRIMEFLERSRILRTTGLDTVYRWIQTKEMFPFFVVFDLLEDDLGQELLFEELKHLPNKAKLIFSSTPVPALPETLVVSGLTTVTAVYEIFTKRWEIMDLLSMMEELRRIVGGIRIHDRLSSSIRFKKLQVKDSA